jgi:hypothetical protein
MCLPLNEVSIDNFSTQHWKLDIEKGINRIIQDYPEIENQISFLLPYITSLSYLPTGFTHNNKKYMVKVIYVYYIEENEKYFLEIHETSDFSKKEYKKR